MAFRHRAQLYDPIQPIHVLIAVLIVAVGAWLRYRGALGDLWLDEIWSLNHAASMNAWHEAFWKVIHDNNHPLNTVYLYLVGDGKEPWVYRLLSIIAGTLSILVAGWAMARDGAGRMLTAMLLVAVVYPLVHFGSEARGYGLMVLFSYIAFIAVDRARERPQNMRWLFGLAVMLGATSHLAILPIVFMMGLAYMVREWRAGRTFWDAIKVTFWFCAPAAFGLAIVGAGLGYGFDHISSAWYGGRAASCPDQGCFVAALDDIARYASGGFGQEHVGLHAGLMAIFTIGIVLGLMMARHGRAYLYLMIFLGAPLIYLALGQPNVPYGRYFIGVFAFVPLILADAMGALRARSKAGRILMGAALLTFITANAWSVTSFHKIGRGQYGKVFEIITQNSGQTPFSIGSDHIFRFSMVFDHMAKRAELGSPIVYVRPEEIIQKRPEWFVRVQRQSSAPPPSNICLGDETTETVVVMYKLITSSLHWGMSGMPWDVYHRQPVSAAHCYKG